jgi:hypothetical protein
MVWLLGRVISSSQGLYLNTGQHKHRINAHTHTHTHTKHPCLVEFEPTIAVSERAKTVHALDRSATVTGSEELGRAICQAVSRRLPTAGSIPALVMWDLWWTKWHWGRFSPTTLVSPANSHSTDCSTLIIYHPGLVITGQIVADLPSEFRLTPPQQIKQNWRIERVWKVLKVLSTDYDWRQHYGEAYAYCELVIFETSRPTNPTVKSQQWEVSHSFRSTEQQTYTFSLLFGYDSNKSKLHSSGN